MTNNLQKSSWTRCKCVCVCTKHYRICCLRLMQGPKIVLFFNIQKPYAQLVFFISLRGRYLVTINCKAHFLQSVFKEHLVSSWGLLFLFPASDFLLDSPPPSTITSPLTGFIYELSSNFKSNQTFSKADRSFTRVFTSCERLWGSVSRKRKRRRQGGSDECKHTFIAILIKPQTQIWQTVMHL